MPNNNQIAENDLKDAWKDPDALKKAPKVRYDSIREAMGDSNSFWDGVGSAITDTALGRNTFGRIGGLVLDIGTMFVPYGSKIDKIREQGKKALNLNKDRNDMKDALKGLLSKQAWKKILTFTDEKGNFSFQETLTTVVQLVVILGALYLADYFGILQQFMTVIGLG